MEVLKLGVFLGISGIIAILGKISLEISKIYNNNDLKTLSTLCFIMAIAFIIFVFIDLIYFPRE